MTERRRAIVTGASRGIGRAIAERLAADGYDLVLAARSTNLLDQLAHDLVLRNGGRALAAPADLRDAAAAGRVVDHAVAGLGGLDLIVHSAGATKRGDFFALTDDDMQDGFALKFHGAVRLVRAAWPHLRAGRDPHVVMIIGSGARTPSADFTIGGPVNAALANFAKAMADRGRTDGVRVNGIHPGPIETERLTARVAALAKETGTGEEEARAAMVAQQRVIRFGKPDEVAALVAFMDGPEGRFLMGSIVDLDGGATKGM